MINPFHFTHSKNGRDFRRAPLWIGAALVLGTALNCLAIVRSCVDGGAFLF